MLYYADHMWEFFSRVHQPSNGLQKAVVDGLGNSDILVGKYVTGPWMGWIPQQFIILEINVPLNEALVRIGDWARDLFPLLGGTVDCAFPGCRIKKDAVYTLLTKMQCDEFENKCSALLTAQPYLSPGCHSVSDEGPPA